MASQNGHRKRGRARELAYLRHLEREGWEAWRIDGTADIVALRSGERPHLLQVKSTVTPYAHFQPAERALLRDQAKRAGAACALIWWPKGKGLRSAEWIDEAAWPN